ncbi:hypothetical protein [Ensifer sp. LBL]|uniref:hypothetical protein n=1 Tax=Ensifer sp. LBL TaxID=2991056 RepID=UPI003D2425C1
MKTPQRRFVVEFKSGRRQPKVPTGSIWGNTDLKTLAREIETESAHLFGHRELGGNGGTDHAADAAVPSFVEEPAVVTASDAAHAVADPVAGAQSDDVVAGSTSAPLMVAKTRSAPKQTSRKKASRPAPNTTLASVGEDPDLQSRSTPMTSLEELAALDAENSRLRKLLANQLRVQNATLKRMLERF